MVAGHGPATVRTTWEGAQQTVSDMAALKEKVALAVRMSEWTGLMDNSGHASIRIPGTDRILVNSRLAPRARVTADSIVTVDLAGQLLEGDALPPVEIVMHTEVYKARPDVGAVLHLHAPCTTLFGMVGKPMEPYYFRGAAVGRVPIYPDSTLVTRPEQGTALARTLGDGRAVILGAHGSLTVGAGIEEAFYLAVHMEGNARMYKDACCIGTPQPLSPEQCQAIFVEVFKQERFLKLWQYYQTKVTMAAAGL